MNNKKAKETTLEAIKNFSVKCNDVDQKFVSLSGGNQQKVVLGKWLATQPKVVVLDEPTRGIDAGARNEIYRIIGELSQQGISVVVISSDFEEIVTLSTRVIVMYNGKTIRELCGDSINLENITYASFGYSKEGVTK
jgi:AI-2 transport system ATP-binding protein